METEQIKKQILIIAGMSRAGTTFLYHNLQKHPEFFVPARKETGFFAQNYDKGLSWYLNFFEEKKTKQIGLDICGIYFTDINSIERILNFNPDAKIIIGVRDPKEWIISLYEQYRGNFNVPDFKEFLNGCTIQREGKEILIDFKNTNIETRLQKFQQAFGKNLMLYDFRLLKENPLFLLKTIEEFAEVSNYFNNSNFTNSKINSRHRRKIQSFDRFLHKQGVVEFIVNNFPRKLILIIRNLIEIYNVKNFRIKNSSMNIYEYSKEEMDLVNQIFCNDKKFVDNLFIQSKIIYGNERFPGN